MPTRTQSAALAALAALGLSAGAAGAADRDALFCFGKKRAATACDAPCDAPGCDTPCVTLRPGPPPAQPPVVVAAPPTGCDAPLTCEGFGCASVGCDGALDAGGRCRACNKDCMKGVKWHSEEWYAMRAHLPPGERQKIKKGKFWLAEPRPCGIEEQPFWHKYHTNKTWPHPYNCQDRGTVRSALASMSERGWIDLCTLQAYHFDVATQELNDAGRTQLTQILHTVPREHRTAYVAAWDRPTAEARMAAVEAGIVDIAGAGERIAVLPRATDAYGRPAVEVEQINRAALQSMPAPVISAGGGATGGGGGAQ